MTVIVIGAPGADVARILGTVFVIFIFGIALLSKNAVLRLISMFLAWGWVIYLLVWAFQGGRWLLALVGSCCIGATMAAYGRGLYQAWRRARPVD